MPDPAGAGTDAAASAVGRLASLPVDRKSAHRAVEQIEIELEQLGDGPGSEARRAELEARRRFWVSLLGVVPIVVVHRAYVQASAAAALGYSLSTLPRLPLGPPQRWRGPMTLPAV